MVTRDVPGRPPSDLVDAAARNNAEWCDVVCRLHGDPGSYHDGAWTVPRRSPQGYPDAVTVDPKANVEAVLAAIDTSPGCSLKDSYACLDLAPAGFHVLFEAWWIALVPSSPALPSPAASDPRAATRWERVRDASALQGWVDAWDREGVTDRPFLPSLVDDDDVIVLAGAVGGTVVAGAIVNRGSAVAGVTNVFSVAGDPDEAWRGSTTAAMTYTGDGPLVGYARGEDLEAARRCGFVPLAPLRVWLR